jgi:hypothetical protein
MVIKGTKGNIKFKNLINYRRPYEDKPNIDYIYEFIYINNDEMSERLGWMTHPYFLVDKNKIIGIYDDGRDIASGYFEKIKEQFNYDAKEYLNKITKIGKIKIKRIGKYKNDNIGFQYSLHLDFHSFIKPVEINKNDIFLYNQTLNDYFEHHKTNDQIYYENSLMEKEDKYNSD